MPKCLYCPSTLDSTTKEQHIITAALGGTLSSKEIVCTPCNERLAGDSDIIIANKYARILNSLGPCLKSDAPILTLTGKTSSTRIKLEPGKVGTLFKADVTKEPDGEFSIKAASIEHGEKVLKTMGKKAREITYAPTPMEQTHIGRAPILAEGEFQFAVKAAMEYLYLKKPALVAAVDLTHAIEYAHTKKAPKRRICFFLDDFAHGRQIVDKHFHKTAFSHKLIVTGGKSGIEALIALFDSIYYRAHLSDTKPASDFTLFYQKNILKDDPADFSNEIDAYTELSDMEEPQDTRQRESQRMNALNAAADWLVDTTCKDFVLDQYIIRLRAGLKPGEKKNIDDTEILEELRRRLEVTFGVGDLRELKLESERIIASLSKTRVRFEDESVDAPSAKMCDWIWNLHTESYLLHKKHVAQPSYGYESYGFVDNL